MYQMYWCRGNIPEEQYMTRTLATVKGGQDGKWKSYKNGYVCFQIWKHTFYFLVMNKRYVRKGIYVLSISMSYHLGKRSDLPFLQHSCKWVSLQLHCWFHQWTSAYPKRNDSTFLSVSCTCWYRICISHWGFSQLGKK